MRLYVIRHGKAERDSASGRDDDRRLTDRGERQALWLGASLSEAEPPVLLAHSPIVRARQTAELVLQTLTCPVEVEPLLATGSAPSDVLRAVQQRESTPSLAIVGHNPHFEDFVGVMCRGIGAGFRLRTGEMAVLELDPHAAPGQAHLLDVRRLEEE